jgi:hypothetical protein
MLAMLAMRCEAALLSLQTTKTRLSVESSPARAACEAQRYLWVIRKSFRSRHELTSVPD